MCLTWQRSEKNFADHSSGLSIELILSRQYLTVTMCSAFETATRIESLVCTLSDAENYTE